MSPGLRYTLVRTHLLVSAHPTSQILIMSMHIDDERLFDAVRVVASAFFSREIDAQELIESLIRIANGEQTVKNHMTSILRKLEVSERVQAVFYAVKHGCIRIGRAAQSSLDRRNQQNHPGFSYPGPRLE